MIGASELRGLRLRYSHWTQVEPIAYRHLEDQEDTEPMKSPFYSAEHEAYRDVVRRFVEREIEPINGTRPASSRARSMRRPPRSACSGSAFQKNMAAFPPTSS